MAAYVSGELKIANINPAPYSEIFFSNVSDDDLWFKVRLAFITINEKTEKEKRTYQTYLVQSKSSETNILDVFEHCAPSKPEEPADSKKASNDSGKKAEK